jgi:hypothetical protein
MARRDFLRVAGIYSGSFAAGAATAERGKLGKGRAAKRSKTPPKKSAPPLVRSVTLPDGVTIPVADWVVHENRRPGTLDWVVSASTMMYGYCDHVSATHGDKVTLYVDAPQPTYRVELYRAGYFSPQFPTGIASTPDIFTSELHEVKTVPVFVSPSS